MGITYNNNSSYNNIFINPNNPDIIYKVIIVLSLKYEINKRSISFLNYEPLRVIELSNSEDKRDLINKEDKEEK